MRDNGHYDIIGDVHGHALTLETLLKKLGYMKEGRAGYFRHPQRTAIFVGDLIDRGKENFRTLEMVKTMVDNGSALVVMGNHDYNALCYHSKDRNGHFLRPHNQRTYAQHKEVLQEIEEKGQGQWDMYLEWFRKMPLFLEMDGLRVVHACWDQASIDFIKNNKIRDEQGRLTDEFLVQSVKKGTEAFSVVEVLLKGREIMLPPGHPGIYDRDNNLRKWLRIKWWMSSRQWLELETYEQAVRADQGILAKIPGLKIPLDILAEAKGMRVGEEGKGTPVFFGHYWFTGEPRPLTETVACLDYSVARGGQLACYRWDGERVLDKSKFVMGHAAT